MAHDNAIGTASGGLVNAGPEQHLHVDHDSAPSYKPSSSEATSEASEVKDRAGGLYQDSKDRIAGGVEDAKQWAGDRYDAARAQISGSAGQAREYLSDVTERGNARVARHRSRIEVFVAENPVLVGVVGLAAGLLVGALLPRTAQEDEAVGPYAAEARDQGLRFAREAMHSGRAYVEAALDQANDVLGQAENRTEANLGAHAPAGETRSGPSGRYQNH